VAALSDADMKTCTLPNGLEVAHLNRGETNFLYREMFIDQVYERHGLTLRPGDIVFDVGANIGFFALAVHLRYPGVRLLCFEPIPEVFDVLTHNIERHGVEARVYPCGLADRNGRMSFTYYPNMSLMSGAYADPAAEYEVSKKFVTNVDPRVASHADVLLRDKFEGRAVECPVRRFSDVVGENALESVSLLKIDVEKGEMDVLAGIDAADWPKIRRVVVEVHDIAGRLVRVETLLRRRGFDVVVDHDRMLQGTGLWNVYAKAQGS
jgi:FkbM family methyltransferase